MAKVMLVEDDNNLREIYEARLAAEGYEIVSAQDGEEALALAVKERPDLIIADVMMPKVSGFDMLDILRSTPETKHSKIIMMTALSQAEDKARAEKLGADRYLVKSQVTLEDVVKVAGEMLSETGAPPAAVTSTSDADANAPVSTPAPTEPPASVNLPTPVEPPAAVAPAPSSPAEPAATTAQTPSAPTPATVASNPIPVTAPPDNTTATPATTSTTPAEEKPAEPVAAPTATEEAEEKTAENATSTAAQEATVSKQIEEFIAGNPSLTTSAEPAKESVPATAPMAEEKPAEPVSVPVASEPSGLVEEVITSAPPVAEAPAPSPSPTPTKTSIPVTVADDEPAQEKISASNDADQTMAKAVEGLLGASPSSTSESTSTASEEKPTESSPDDDAPKAAPKRGGERVITPLSDPRDSGPDLNALLAQEEANEGLAAPSVNTVISPDGTVTSSNDVTPKNESFDASPGSVVQAPSTTTDTQSSSGTDPNNISL